MSQKDLDYNSYSDYFTLFMLKLRGHIHGWREGRVGGWMVSNSTL